MDKDIEIDLRKRQPWPEIVSRAGGYPLLVLPLDSESKGVAQGRACRDQAELMAALGWALGSSPDYRIRLIPIEATKPEV